MNEDARGFYGKLARREGLGHVYVRRRWVGRREYI